MSLSEKVEDARTAANGLAAGNTDEAHNATQDAPSSQHSMKEHSNEEDDGDEEGDEDVDDSDGEPVEWLASGRERRATAGKNMKTLLAAQEEDEELDLLFAEAEEEDVDFQSSEAEVVDAGEEDDSSSSSDEDDKPVDELEGEKELQQEERAQRKASNKRKTVFKIPVAAKRSRVDQSSSPSDATTAATSATQRPRKKSERISWLPTDVDAPLRTSSRTLSVQHKEKTIASLKEAEQRRKRQLKVLEEANKRKEARKKKPMTQAERLAEAAETEAVNLRSLHRWEEVENERLRKQQERLAQMHSRVIEGPFVRYYSGPAEWINGNLRRIGNPNKVEELIEIDIPTEKPVPKKKRLGKYKADETNTSADQDEATGELTQADSSNNASADNPAEAQKDAENEQPLPVTPADGADKDGSTPVALETTAEAPQPGSSAGAKSPDKKEDETGQTSLADSPEKIQGAESSEDSTNLRKSAEIIANDGDDEHEDVADSQPPVDVVEMDTDATRDVGQAEGTSEVEMTDGTIVEVKEEEAEEDKGPQVKETSAYQSISLHNYSTNLPAGPAILNRIMLGYDASNHSTKTTSTNCYVSGLPARYRDPQTGVPYRGVEEFKVIRRAAGLASGDKPIWSSLLNAYVGSNRVLPARGVPDSFMTGKVRPAQQPPPPQQAAATSPSPSAPSVPQTRSATAA